MEEDVSLYNSKVKITAKTMYFQNSLEHDEPFLRTQIYVGLKK